MKKFAMAGLFFQIILSYASVVWAGNTDSPGAPSSGSGMVTVNELYNYLNSGATPLMEPGSFQMPGTAPGPSMNSVQDIYNNTKSKFDQCNVEPNQVLSGAKYF
ncbi:MAG: hypothetical protein GY869_04770, partial [Planctomycetes bacterium]|nr:hypothetical protein [Planctomycetota bacterium]